MTSVILAHSKPSAKIMTHGDLWLTQPLDVENSIMIDPHWYMIRSNGKIHATFMHRAAMDKWLQLRGLSLTKRLADTGLHGVQRIKGCYQTACHRDTSDFIDIPNVIASTYVLSNGEYTTGRVIDLFGVRQVHYVSSTMDRTVYDYDTIRKIMF